MILFVLSCSHLVKHSGGYAWNRPHSTEARRFVASVFPFERHLCVLWKIQHNSQRSWGVKETEEVHGDERVCDLFPLHLRWSSHHQSGRFSHFYSFWKLVRWQCNNRPHKAVCAYECDVTNCVSVTCARFVAWRASSQLTGQNKLGNKRVYNIAGVGK